MLKKILLITLLIIGITAVFIFDQILLSSDKQESSTTPKNQLKIFTSLYPLSFFASEIAGEKAEVINLIPAGVDPHDFEPSVQDLQQLSTADLIIGNGLGFEPWLEKFAENIPENKLLLASTTITQELITANHDDHGKHGENDKHEGNFTIDPHVWLDPTLAMKQVQAISDKIQALDPTNVATYQKNTIALLEKLQVLDQQFQQNLDTCQKQHVITAHQAFAYLAARYGFEQISILGLNPEEEPSPATVAQLTQLAKQHGITHIFFESTLSPKLANTIAQEVGATTLVFHPLENLTTAEQQAGETYFSVQERNLAHLGLAMHCQ